MAIITLFHGSPYESVTPEYGLGNDKHDYGRGFYLTANVELAKEWAVCRPDESNGWVHQYELDTNGLRILDFQEHSVLTWLAELMKHRDAADSKRYRVLAAKFIAKYGIDASGYDVQATARSPGRPAFRQLQRIQRQIQSEGCRGTPKHARPHRFRCQYGDQRVQHVALGVMTMRAYPEVYRDDVVETQGKLFDCVAQSFPNKSTEDFITVYMASKTRKSIDEAKAYVNTMDAKELWKYFTETEHYQLKDGRALEGFMPDWIGEFYAYYQWFYGIPSAEVIAKVPLDFLKKAYFGLHDLDLELAVRKVGEE